MINWDLFVFMVLKVCILIENELLLGRIDFEDSYRGFHLVWDLGVVE